MPKDTAAAIAAVLCRAIDYFHARAMAERDAYGRPLGSLEASKIIDRLLDSENAVASALEKVADED